ncbi:hypothetical protein AM571_CH01432 [Rhizobium etli 8C-3]|uniref:Uncharacterized protein n=1 Tax=Rhizobium etli 8C-3 TaxID=538025 RepID=A0A1L5P2B1_RHIET|nr:hypothetical protein [Rhizobium etli]APO74267.1 hypothetical protein AM571_CH01432 [Rhizobium etli 8C-3]
MSKTDQIEEAKVVREDPVAKLYRDLRTAGDGPDKTAARKLVAGMTQRPWEQLPPGLKSAIRADIGRFVDDKKTIENMFEAGYSATLVRRALRDLGKGSL